MKRVRNSTALIALCAIIGLGLLVSTGSADAAEIADEIAILASPEPPAAPPPPADISEDDWPARKHEYWVDRRLTARQNLSEHGRDAVRPLLELALEDDHWAVRLDALTALHEMNAEDLENVGQQVAELLAQDHHSTVRFLAARLIQKTGYSDEATRNRLHLLTEDDNEPALRMIAADALGQVGDIKSAPVLIRLLERESEVAKAIAEREPGLSDEELSQREDSKMVRLTAIRALGQLGAAVEVVPVLITKLESADLNEQQAAARAIGELLAYDLTGRAAWPLAHRRADIIEEFKSWWQNISELDPLPAQNAELGFWMKIVHNKDIDDSIRLNAARQIRQIGEEGNLRMAEDLIEVMHFSELFDIRRVLAEAAEKFSGIEIQPREGRAEWAREVTDFFRRLRERIEE